LLGTDLTTLIADDSTTYVTTRPKAFLNWMVVGEDYVAATSSPNHVSAIQVPVCNAGDSLKQIVGPTNMVIRRNGWIYIYLSNQSNQDVFFDNLVVNFKHGPLVEQKVYYAFGMENPALSTKALKYNYDENRIKYNGIEYDTAFGLDYYEAFYRDLDPQIGRWTTIDPKIEDGQESISPYASMNNNPVKLKDPKGDVPCCEFAGQFWQTTQQVATSLAESSDGGENPVSDIGIAAVEIVGTVGTAIIGLGEFFTENTPAPPAPAKLTTPAATTPAAQTNAIVKKGPKDLAQEGKDAIAKREATQARAAQKQAATVQGKAKEGKSNQGTRGSHDSGKRNSNKHDKAEARRKPEQDAADRKAAETKK
jgi:RHS repeat-associated protein